MIFLEKEREKIRQYRQRCQQFIFLHAKRIGVFVKNEYKQIIAFVLFILFIFLALIISNFTVSWLLSMNYFELLYFLVLYALLFIIVYLYFVLVIRARWFKKAQGLIIVLGVMIPIILFSWQQCLNEKDIFLKQAVSLAEENNRNSDHLKSVETDIKNDKYVLFWRNFSTNSYKEYWSYIHLKYSQECKNLYADLTIKLDNLNDMIQTRNDLLIRPGFIQMSIEKLNTDIMDGASKTDPILNKIISECQQ
ncbi:MAG: hypothetical protein PHW33_01070 [Candidatus Portnoybacteria bacterium]|jgi:hypothetical protein|nr:hypothetical protein [Candidatus Portnoybacteria bacterium]